MLPGLRRLFTFGKTTPQLAHISAKEVHDLQHQIRETHRKWEEVKLSLKHVRRLSENLPKGPHHKALGEVYTYIDAFVKIEKRYDKKLDKLLEHVEGLEKALEEQTKQKD